MILPKAKNEHFDLVVGPQPGFQYNFLSSCADITFGGGTAGCGKTYAELIAPVKWIHLPDFRCTFFRRSMEEIRDPGGLWDESLKIYLPMGARPIEHTAQWKWPSGAEISMDHLQYDHTVFKKQGSQIGLMIFDELTHFTSDQFWYMQSRNRSGCGIKPYTLGTCNPDPDSWVAKVIEWWIDQDPASKRYGLPILSRAGVLRWFTRFDGEFIWGNNRREVMAQLPPNSEITIQDVQSLTFIPGKLEDNPRMRDKDPRYRGKLLAMTRVNKARLYDGNWKERASKGSYFRRADVKILDRAPDPASLAIVTRRWDLAASEPTENYPDPDYTYGVKLARYKDGRFVVLHAKAVRKRSFEVRELVHGLAEEDVEQHPACSVGIPEDPAQAGKDQVQSYSTNLANFSFYADRETGDKETRVEPCAAQWQQGNFDVVKGDWNELFFAQLEGFPDQKVHDDAVDALGGAYKHCLKEEDIFAYYK